MDHAYLLPAGRRLQFPPRGEVFGVKLTDAMNGEARLSGMLVETEPERTL